jgi:tRNA dimethylallyltransferase
MGSKNCLIVLCGPTGIGKTKVAIELAKTLGCEIISADSRQLYTEMHIGTAVPSNEDLALVPHHFIQSHTIHQSYNASKFEEEVLRFLESYFHRKSIALMVGGSGLYIDAVCKGIDDLPAIEPKVREKWAGLYKKHGIDYLCEQVKEIDPDYLAKVDKYNPKRLLKALEVYEMTGKPYSSFLNHEAKARSFSIIKIGLDMQREKLYEQINHRVNRMVHDGLVAEAKELIAFRHLTPLNTVGYKELFSYFNGELSLDEAIGKIKDHTRAYARRQLTWFRRDKDIQWFEPKDIPAIKSYIETSIIK